MEKSVSSSPISRASAKRCSTLLDEAPMALSTATALRRALGVMMSRGRRPFSTARITAAPVSFASISRREYTMGMVPLPGRAMPSASVRQLRLLAVNMPEHEPQVGQEEHSYSCSSASSILPAL